MIYGRTVCKGLIVLLTGSCLGTSFGADSQLPQAEFKVFQFPKDKIPRIDGDLDDWSMVSDDYAIGLEHIRDVVNGRQPDEANFDVKVRLGWVKGLARLYVLYEAFDDYWSFDSSGLSQDIFEIVVDADRSGGPLIAQFKEGLPVDSWEGHIFHGVHAQNYHIFTPAVGKKWALAWGCQPWVADFPWANAASSYNFRHGQSGKLILEFWITPFDHAPFEGPSRALVSQLEENRNIGFSFAVLERDNREKARKDRFAFWTLSPGKTMYGDASELLPFRLMPLETRFRQSLEAHWSFQVLDLAEGLVAFKDESVGDITAWHWDFGDGSTSTDKNPIHRFRSPSHLPDRNTYPYTYAITLKIEGPQGKVQLSKIWEVAVKVPVGEGNERR